MEDFLFKIKNLECSYDPKEKPVFFIKDLVIPKDKITVILGKSGSGKSTLVETLGLMNDTIQGGEILFSNHDEEFSINRSLWENPRRMAEIRRKYFSFIFQDDYLMPYYSTSENALISHLIQGHEVDYAIYRSLITKLRSVNLGQRLLRKRKPFQMAGGQKQRLSFTRAILKDFTAIFGDEPTGNLDEKNSEDLMDVIRDSLNGKNGCMQKRRAAIIVSHNICLSVKKADMIVLFTPVNNNGGPFEVKKECVFTRIAEESWQDGYGAHIHGNETLVLKIKTIL